MAISAMDPKAVKSDLVFILDYGSHTPTSSLAASDPSPSSPSPSPAPAPSRPSPTSTPALSSSPAVPIPSTPMTPPASQPGSPSGSEAHDFFVRGICYGLQLIVQKLGWVVRAGKKQDYGKMEIVVESNSGIFRDQEGWGYPGVQGDGAELAGSGGRH